MAVPTLFFLYLFRNSRADNIRLYKHFIIYVWLSEDAQRAPLLLINVVFVIVLLYGNDVGTAIGRPLTNNRQIVGAGALNTCPSPLSLRDISPHCGESPDSPLFYDDIRLF